MSNGSLFEYIRKNHDKMDLKQIVKWSLEIADGLKWLHHWKLVHRDLKSQNVMVFITKYFLTLLNKISADMTCKIIDFGTSRVVDIRMTKSIGTPAWIAPEVFQTESYTEKADVYSFG